MGSKFFKRVAACVLPILLIVNSISFTAGLVLAEGDENPVIAEETEGFLYDLPEGGKVEIGAQVEPGDTRYCTFTPEVSGRYGFLCAGGSDRTVTVTDSYGTEVVPQETYQGLQYVLIYLRLDAGRSYKFHIHEPQDSSSPNYTLIVARTPRELSVGETIEFVKGGQFESFPFTPEESGMYSFCVTSSDRYSIQMRDDSEYSIWGYDIDYGASKIVYVELTAGSTYYLNISSNENEYKCSEMYVKVEYGVQELREDENTVSFTQNRPTVRCSFTPEDTDVYIIESMGEYSVSASLTGFPGADSGSGEGNNFRMGVLLEAGKTYYPSFYHYGMDSVTIRISRADSVVMGGNTTYSVAPNEVEYYSFVPTASGYFIMGTTPRVSDWWVKEVVDGSSETVPTMGRVAYLEAEKHYFIDNSNRYESTTKECSFFFKPLTKALAMGQETTLPKEVDDYGYALFTPDTSGTYTFTTSELCRNCYLYSSGGESVASIANPDNQKSMTVVLKAGETYVFAIGFITWGDDPADSTVVTVAKSESTVLNLGTNTVQFSDTEDKFYTFTPDVSGIYQLYHENNDYYSLSYYDGVGKLYPKTSDTYGFKGAYIYMEAGHEYTLEFGHQYIYESDYILPFYIEKLPVLQTGTNQVNRPRFDFFAEFTPAESGVYAFSSEEYLYNNYLQGGRSFDTSPSPFYRDDDSVYHVYLEAGNTYLACLQQSGDATSVPYTVEKEQLLEPGRNDVHIAEGSDSNQMKYVYSYFNVIVPEDGNYTFYSEQEGSSLILGRMYGDSYYPTFVDGDEENGGNISFSMDLHAGQLYRLALCSPYEPEGLDASIIFKKTVNTEAILAGYSLSLDGSIGINLYMELDDSITSSDSSLLAVYLPNDVRYRLWVHNNLDNTRVVDGKSYYVFTVPMAAKEMTTTMQVQILDTSTGFEGRLYDINVRQYAEYILDNAYYDDEVTVKNQAYADAVPLVKAMLNYGAAAQTFFNYNTGDLANKNLSDADKNLASVKPASLPKYDEQTENLPSGVTFCGASLTLKSETSLNFYFEADPGVQVYFSQDSDPDGLYQMPTIVGNYLKVSIMGIPAHRLDETFTMYVFVDGECYSVSYCPLNYCRIVLEQTEPAATYTPELKALTQALYLYNQQANAYLEK